MSGSIGSVNTLARMLRTATTPGGATKDELTKAAQQHESPRLFALRENIQQIVSRIKHFLGISDVADTMCTIGVKRAFGRIEFANKIINTLATNLPEIEQIPAEGGDFRYQLPDDSKVTLQLYKYVEENGARRVGITLQRVFGGVLPITVLSISLGDQQYSELRTNLASEAQASCASLGGPGNVTTGGVSLPSISERSSIPCRQSVVHADAAVAVADRVKHYIGHRMATLFLQQFAQQFRLITSTRGLSYAVDSLTSFTIVTIASGVVSYQLTALDRKHEPVEICRISTGDELQAFIATLQEIVSTTFPEQVTPARLKAEVDEGMVQLRARRACLRQAPTNVQKSDNHPQGSVAPHEVNMTRAPHLVPTTPIPDTPERQIAHGTIVTPPFSGWHKGSRVERQLFADDEVVPALTPQPAEILTAISTKKPGADGNIGVPQSPAKSHRVPFGSPSKSSVTTPSVTTPSKLEHDDVRRKLFADDMLDTPLKAVIVNTALLSPSKSSNELTGSPRKPVTQS